MQYIDRQRNVEFRYTRTHVTAPLVVSRLQHHADDAGVSDAEPYRPGGEVQRRAVSRHSIAAAGSVMQAYGNLFQGQQNFTWTRRGTRVEVGSRRG